jgi:hypothetical protein
MRWADIRILNGIAGSGECRVPGRNAGRKASTAAPSLVYGDWERQGGGGTEKLASRARRVLAAVASPRKREILRLEMSPEGRLASVVGLRGEPSSAEPGRK